MDVLVTRTDDNYSKYLMPLEQSGFKPRWTATEVEFRVSRRIGGKEINCV
jgi:hypothetical protein